MTDIERRLRRLEADIKEQERKAKAEERAKVVNGEYPMTKEVKKTLYEVRCGNCGELWSYSESALLSSYFEGWRFCPMCGVKILGVCK